MDNTSPARSPDSERSKKQTKGSPSLSWKNNADAYAKSCFSDDEGKEEKDKDIEELAEEHDHLTRSRQELFETMSAKLKTPGSARKETYYINTKEAKSASLYSPSIPQQKDAALSDNQGAERSPAIFSPLEVPGNKKNAYLVEHAIPIGEESEESCQIDDIKIEPGTFQAIPEIAFEDPMQSRKKTSTNELPVVEGFLQKKSTNIFRGWQKRYFLLKNKKLYYYINEHKEIKSGVIDFDLVSVKLERETNKTDMKITPIGGSRVFKLRTTSEEEREKWFNAIGKHVQASKGAASNLTKTSCLKNFWKNDRISVQMFLDQIETGDIILFKSVTILSKLQRSVTGSEFDHVALIVKYGRETNKICLFEAMREGVGLCRWSTFMDKNWHKLYEKMIYRKLVIPRTQEVNNEIEKFVKANVGKKFKITPAKLLKKKSTVNSSSDDKTFFCSELVASCYKKLGFLPPDISAANYYPGTFAAEKKLILLNAAKLSQEYLIDFNL